MSVGKRDRNEVYKNALTRVSDTIQSGKDFIAKNGRILTVNALGETISEAQNEVYREIKNQKWDKVQLRTDIGYKELARENT